MNKYIAILYVNGNAYVSANFEYILIRKKQHLGKYFRNLQLKNNYLQLL